MDNMDNDLDNIFEEAEAYLKRSLARWKAHLPEMWEDAFQEGMIQVWRDIEAGVDGGATTKLKILRRASQKANNFFHRNGEYYFGKPPKSREGIRQNSQVLDKVQVYLDEVMPLRGHVYPTPREVAQALGVSDAAAGTALRAIKSGNIDHMKYREDGRKDWDYYSVHSVESLATDHEKVTNRHWTDSKEVAPYSFRFENEVVGTLDLMSLLKRLHPDHQEILYYYLFEGYSRTEIARMRGYEVNAAAKGNRTLQAALSQVSMLVNPYDGACSAGHTRTPETTRVIQRRGTGYYTRQCTICCKANGGAKTPGKGKRIGRKVEPYCPQGHKKDSVDSHGRLRCSKCRAEAQRRYVQRKRDAGSN